MNFVVLYCNKNQYEMFEEFSFKYSPTDFSKVDILVFVSISELSLLAANAASSER